MGCTVVWFRRDLRLNDHAALCAACSRGAVLPLFVLDRDLLFHPETAVARVAFMLESLKALDAELRQRGGRLLTRWGDPAEVLVQLVRASGADGVIAHTDSERLVGRVRDARVSRSLAAAGIPLRWLEPAGATGELMPYSSWSHQWHQAMASPALPAPEQLVVPAPSSALPDQPVPSLEALGLRPDAKPIPPGGSAAASCRGISPMSRAGTAVSPRAKVCSTSSALRTVVVSPDSRKTPPRNGWKNRSIITDENPSACNAASALVPSECREKSNPPSRNRPTRSLSAKVPMGLNAHASQSNGCRKGSAKRCQRPPKRTSAPGWNGRRSSAA